MRPFIALLALAASAAAAEDRPLAGPLWRLTAMGDAPVTAEGQRETPHLVFDAEGAVAGSGGCNRLRGGYALGPEGAIEIGPVASTMMACPEPAMRLEHAFARMLETVDHMAIEGDRLTLIANAAPLASFEAEANPEP
jgi:heat shock protein HslJ